MANQPEQPIFDSGVYQLETTDPVLGGTGGLSNIPLLNLANRTLWLKQEVDAINVTLPTKAPLQSPALTGAPTAPTQALENEATRIATTAFARGVVSGKMQKALSGSSGVTLTASEAGNGLLLFTGAITAAVNIIVPNASRRWIVYNGTSGGFAITIKTAAAAGVSVPPGMALELWCDDSVVRTVAANAWATPRKLTLNGPVTGEATVDGSADVAMQTAVVAATDAQSGLVELATGPETIAGTDAGRAVTPAGLAALTATTTRRGLVELATDAEVDAGTDAERAVTPAGVKRRIDTRATTARTITAGNGLTGGGDLSADRTLTLGTPGTLSTVTANAVSAESHTHAVTFPVTSVAGRGGAVALAKGDVGLGNVQNVDQTNAANVTAGVFSIDRMPMAVRNRAEGATDQDPDLAVDPVILTNHANSPNSSYYWHITTTFYSTISATANRGQIAVQYNGGAQVWSRSSYGGVWTAWTRVDNVVTSVAGKTGAVTLAKGDVGLGNVDNVKQAPSARTITAGNGLTGGGDLSADRTLTLGLPGTLSGSTTNAVTATSHTHALAAATTSAAGVVELATNAETLAGTDAAKAVTPAALASFTKSLGTNGYARLPGGMILQWGNVDATAANTGGTITFPLAFPGGCLMVMTTSKGANNTSDLRANIGSWSAASFTYYMQDVGGYTTATAWCWFAIGY